MFRLRSRFNAFYRLAASLALLALLVPMGTMLVHHPASSFMPNCGMDMGQKAPARTPAKSPAGLPKCPICQSLHILAGGFVPPDEIAAAALAPVAGDFIAHERAFSLRPAFVTQGRPRAPPFSA